MKTTKAIRNIFFGLSIFTFAVFLLGLFHRTIHYDEPILAEQVLSFQNLGFIKAELFDGMGKDWEVRQYHFHKFFIFSGVAVTKFFGFNIWVLRSLTFIFFIGLLVSLVAYLKTEKYHNKLIYPILFTVLLINITFFEYSFLFRPEIIIAAMGFFSFFLLHLFFKRKNSWLIIGSGTVAGLAAFTHLNGLSFIMTGGLLLLIHRKWKESFLFGTTAGLVTLFYFIDLNSFAELSAFWEQFRSDPNLNENDFKVLHAIGKILNEHMRFFWNLPTAAFSAVYIFCLVFNFSYFKKEHPILLWYHFILIACLAAIAQSKTIKYALVYYPFMVLIISISMHNFFIDRKFDRRFWIQTGLFVVYFVINFSAAILFMSKDTTNDLIKKNEIYSEHMLKENANVLTTASFYFNSYQKYNIHLILAYELLHEIYLQTPRSKEGFYDFARSRGNDYILLRNLPLNSNMLTLIEFDKLKEGMVNFGYRVIFKNEKVVILEKEDNGKEIDF